MKISAAIITHNEELNIARAIESLRCCDEIVVIDSGSSDRTVELAQNHGARVVETFWRGYAAQKNFASESCKHDWILSIDADEALSEALEGEIWQLKKNGPRHDGYTMPRLAQHQFGAGKFTGQFHQRVQFAGIFAAEAGYVLQILRRLYVRYPVHDNPDFLRCNADPFEFFGYGLGDRKVGGGAGILPVGEPILLDRKRDTPRDHKGAQATDCGEGVGVGILDMHNIHAAARSYHRDEADLPGIESRCQCEIPQQGSLPRQKPNTVALFAQAFGQIESLPLAATHFPSRIDKKNLHRCGDIFLALAYLRKV